jgi:hypothetical protein
MQPFTFIGFVDCWALAATLRGKLGLFEEDGKYVARALYDANEWRWTGEIRKEWTALWNVVARLQRQPAAAEMEFGAVWIEQLKPHSEGTWLAAESGEWVEGRVALVTNPSTHIFCGLTVQHLPIGHLCLVSRGYPRCAVNWGETPAYTLHIEFRKKEEERGIEL